MLKVIKPFAGVKDGEIIPVDFAAGDTVEGELGAIALREGWAEEVVEDETKATNPAANKALSKALENK